MSTIFSLTTTQDNQEIAIPFEFDPNYSEIIVRDQDANDISFTYDNIYNFITVDALAGTYLTVRRLTQAPTDDLSGGALSSAKLNDIYKRQRLALIELQDGGAILIKDDLNMRNFKILNLGNGENPTDAVNKSQLTPINDALTSLIGRIDALENAPLYENTLTANGYLSIYNNIDYKNHSMTPTSTISASQTSTSTVNNSTTAYKFFPNMLLSGPTSSITVIEYQNNHTCKRDITFTSATSGNIQLTFFCKNGFGDWLGVKNTNPFFNLELSNISQFTSMIINGLKFGKIDRNGIATTYYSGGLTASNTVLAPLTNGKANINSARTQISIAIIRNTLTSFVEETSGQLSSGEEYFFTVNLNYNAAAASVKTFTVNSYAGYEPFGFAPKRMMFDELTASTKLFKPFLVPKAVGFFGSQLYDAKVNFDLDPFNLHYPSQTNTPPNSTILESTNYTSTPTRMTPVGDKQITSGTTFKYSDVSVLSPRSYLNNNNSNSCMGLSHDCVYKYLTLTGWYSNTVAITINQSTGTLTSTNGFNNTYFNAKPSVFL